MRTRTTMAVLATTATLILGAAVQAQAASPLTLTPTSASTQNDIYVPLAGSASTLIVSRQPRLSRDVNESASAEPPYSSAPETMYVRSSSGHLRKLGTLPGLAEPFGFSLVGTTLAAAKSVDDDSPVTNQAYVWRTTTGQRTEITLPSGDVYLAAAPDGVLFVTAKGVLAIRTISGATTTLATPFGATTHASIIGAAVDATGAVVSDTTGHIAFIGFAAPHPATTLQNPSPGSPIACYHAAGKYAACAEAVYNDDVGAYDAGDPVIEPLDGSAPTVDTTSGCSEPFELAMSGSTELWTCPDWTTPDVNDYTLDSLAAGSPSSVTSSTSQHFPLVSAYGKAIGSTLLQDSLYEATSASDVDTLIPVTPSPVTVDAFQLTPTALIYSDDQRVGSRHGQIESVFKRSLSTSRSTLHASHPTLVGPFASGITGNLIGISKSLRVYATTGAVKDQFGTAVLHVHSSHGVATLPNVIGQGVIQVSGDRILYQRPAKSGSENVVYDAATNKTTVAEKVGGIDYSGVALAGHFVAYATRHGAVYREDLLTGKKVLLHKALPGDVGGVEFDVYASGNWVGWHALPVQHELAKPLDQIRNAKTMAPAISMHHTLFSLTSAGAILDSTHATFRIGSSEADQVAKPSKFWLRSYAGHTRSLLPKASYVAGPEIAGHVLAWADAHGVLRARLLAAS